MSAVATKSLPQRAAVVEHPVPKPTAKCDYCRRTAEETCEMCGLDLCYTHALFAERGTRIFCSMCHQRRYPRCHHCRRPAISRCSTCPASLCENCETTCSSIHYPYSNQAYCRDCRHTETRACDACRNCARTVTATTCAACKDTLRLCAKCERGDRNKCALCLRRYCEKCLGVHCNICSERLCTKCVPQKTLPQCGAPSCRRPVCGLCSAECKVCAAQTCVTHHPNSNQSCAACPL